MSPENAKMTVKEWADEWDPNFIVDEFATLMERINIEMEHESALTIAMGVGIEAHLLQDGRAMTANILEQVVRDLRNGHPRFAKYPA